MLFVRLADDARAMAEIDPAFRLSNFVVIYGYQSFRLGGDIQVCSPIVEVNGKEYFAVTREGWPAATLPLALATYRPPMPEVRNLGYEGLKRLLTAAFTYDDAVQVFNAEVEELFDGGK